MFFFNCFIKKENTKLIKLLDGLIKRINKELIYSSISSQDRYRKLLIISTEIRRLQEGLKKQTKTKEDVINYLEHELTYERLRNL